MSSLDDPQTVAHYVLRHYGIEGPWFRPGSFAEQLTAAFAAADVSNRRRLGRAFPVFEDAFDVLDGRDHRATSPDLQTALERGLQQLRERALGYSAASS